MGEAECLKCLCVFYVCSLFDVFLRNCIMAKLVFIRVLMSLKKRQRDRDGDRERDGESVCVCVINAGMTLMRGNEQDCNCYGG